MEIEIFVLPFKYQPKPSVKIVCRFKLVAGTSFNDPVWILRRCFLGISVTFLYFLFLVGSLHFAVDSIEFR